MKMNLREEQEKRCRACGKDHGYPWCTECKICGQVHRFSKEQPNPFCKGKSEEGEKGTVDRKKTLKVKKTTAVVEAINSAMSEKFSRLEDTIKALSGLKDPQ
jgi:hypothetical protein